MSGELILAGSLLEFDQGQHVSAVPACGKRLEVGMPPLAYGIWSGAEMLKPLAIAVIGSQCISVLPIAVPIIVQVCFTRG
jgi:hypothetical protein